MIGSTAALANGLIAEEVFTVQATTELLEETKHIVDAVHHREAQKMLLPIKCGWKRKTTPVYTLFLTNRIIKPLPRGGGGFLSSQPNLNLSAKRLKKS